MHDMDDSGCIEPAAQLSSNVFILNELILVNLCREQNTEETEMVDVTDTMSIQRYITHVIILLQERHIVNTCRVD